MKQNNMAVIELKGLQGLKGLSAEEQKAWYEKYPKNYSRTFEQADRVYRNQQFINRYGTDAFNAMPNAADRDKKFFDDVVTDTFDETFYNISDEVGEDIAKQLFGMTVAGKYDLLQRLPSVDANNEDIRQLREDNARKNERYAEQASYDWMTAYSVDSKNQGVENTITSIQDERSKIVKEVLDTDLDRVLHSPQVQNLVTQQIEGWNTALANDEISQGEFEQFLDRVLLNETEEPQFVTKVPTAKDANYYKAFKDSKYLEGWTIEDKKKKVAEIAAMAQVTGNGNTAYYTFNNALQNEIHNKQSFLERRLLDLKNLVPGTANAIVEPFAGITALGVSMIYGDEGLENYLNGRYPKSGEQMPLILSPRYWEDVDKYNTFSPEEIARAEEAGGISIYTPVYKVGSDMSKEQMFGESLRMGKFAIAYLLLGGAEAFATKGLARAAGGTFADVAASTAERKLASSWMSPKAVLTDASPVASKVINKVGAAAQVVTPATGIGFAYATNGYTQTLNEAGARINEEIARRAGIQATDIFNSDAAQVELNKRVSQRLQDVFTTEEGERMSDEQITQVLSYIFGYDPLSAESTSEEDAQAKMQLLQDAFKQQETQKMLYEYYEAVAPDIVNSSEIKLLEEQAMSSALSTFVVDATIETLSQIPATFLFRQYLFNKGTRQALNSNNPFLKGVTQQGNKFSLQGAAMRKARQIVRPALGGAWSNYMDDVRLGFAQGFGMGSFNNVLEKVQDPEAHVDTTDLVSSFIGPLALGDAWEEANRRGQAALKDKQSLTDGFIGGFGTLLTLTPRIGGYGKSFRTDAAGNRLSFTESLNKYINNPLLDAYSSASEQAREAQFVIDRANEAIANHQEQLNQISQFIAGTHILTNAQLGDNTLDAKDAKMLQAYQLGMTLANMRADAIIGKHSTVAEAQQLLEDVANDRLDQEQLANLANQLLNQPENKSLRESETAMQDAVEILKKNANKILGVQKAIADVNGEIKKSKLNGKISPEMISQLVYSKIMLQDWRDRASEIQSELGVSDGNSGLSNPAFYGNKRNWETELASYQDTYEQLSKKYDDAVSDLASAKLAMKGEKSAARRLVYEKRIIPAKELQRDALFEAKWQLESEMEQIKSIGEMFDQEGGLSILSESEILGLDAVSRAKMISSENLSHYSKAQQNIIKRTIKNLINKDSDAIEKISDLAELQHRIDRTSDSYAKILQNPSSFEQYVQFLKEARANLVVNGLRERAKQIHFDKLLEASGRTDKRTKQPKFTDEFKQLVKNSSADVLSDFATKYPEYSDYLAPLVERQRTIGILNQTIESFNIPTNQKRTLKGGLYSITENAETAQDVIDAIEDFIDNTDLSDSDGLTLREQMNEILARATDNGIVRNAVKVENRGDNLEKERIARNKKDERNRKDRERRAKLKAEKEARAAEEERLRQEAEAKEKGKKMKGAKMEDNAAQPGETTFEEAEGEMIEGLEGVEPYSPTKEEVKTPEVVAEDSETTIEPEPITSTDETLEPTAETSEATQLRGNTLTPYSVESLDEAKLVSREETVTDWLKDFFAWMKNAGIKFQDIIDFELADIAKLNPTVHYMMAVPQENATNDKVLVKTPLLVVEATEQVKKIHKEDRGGIIASNGKEWLVIGMMGFAPNSNEQATWQKTLNKLSANRDVYFKSHPTERFEVDEKNTTNIKDIALGKLIRQLPGDSEVLHRTISELLSSDARNPYGLTWKDLSFAIQMATGGFDLSRTLDGTVYAPKRTVENAGNVFLMVKAANGNFVPVAIKPTFLNEIRPGAMQNTIDNLLMQLTSQNHKERFDAISKLKFLLNFDETNNILIGTESRNTLSIKENGVVVETFNLDAEDLNRADIFNKLKSARFRIQISKDNLSDVERLQQLDEAGCLTTDIALLGTAGSHYTIYATDLNTGKPIQPAPITNNGNDVVRGSAINMTKEPSQLLDGKRVTFHNGSWIDESGKVITDALQLRQIKALNYIEENQLEPAYTDSKGFKVYVIRSSKEQPLCVRVNQSHNTQILEGQDALNAINHASETQRAAKAKITSVEEIDLGLDSSPEDALNGMLPDVTKNQGKPKEKIKGTEKFSEVNREKSLKDLQDSKNLPIFANIIRNSATRAQLKEIFQAKNWEMPKSIADIEKFLKAKDIPMPLDLSQESIDKWLELIKNCR